MTKKLQELIEEFGRLLIMLRANPNLEFEPHVFKHKLMEIAQLAEEEGYIRAREDARAYIRKLDSNWGGEGKKLQKIYEYLSNNKEDDK